MDDAALIDHEARSVSEIPLVRRISRVSSTLSSSAGLSPAHERPAASCNLSTSGSGGNGNNAAPASGQEHAVAMPMRSASPASTAAVTADEDVSKLDLAIMGCTIALLMPMAVGGLDWESRWKVLYGTLMIVSIVSTIIGFLTAVAGRPGRSRLSPSCARMGLVLAAALFVVFLSCRLARFGCLGGVAAAAVVLLILVVVWVLSELPIADAAAAEGVTSSVSLPPDAP